ncbi:hypothetical protein CR513_46270, partial [Mucuna pruriens]
MESHGHIPHEGFKEVETPALEGSMTRGARFLSSSPSLKEFALKFESEIPKKEYKSNDMEVNCYPLTRLTRWCKTSQNPFCCSQLLVIMAEDKVITLGPNELPNLAQYICTTLKEHKNMSHIEGNNPPRDYPKFEAWDDEDSLIMTWLWNSMTPKISRNYMFYSSIHEIWENLIETYSIKKDSTACYDIESKIFNFGQGTLSVLEYYGTLNGLWIELDQYQGLKMCRADSIAYTGLVERGRIFKFLHDLNYKYDPIRVWILGKEKLPSLSKVFFIVRSEEAR